MVENLSAADDNPRTGAVDSWECILSERILISIFQHKKAKVWSLYDSDLSIVKHHNAEVGGSAIPQIINIFQVSMEECLEIICIIQLNAAANIKGRHFFCWGSAPPRAHKYTHTLKTKN